MKAIGEHYYAAVLVPYDERFNIHERAFRGLIRSFVEEPRFLRNGGLIVNPEAGEIFFLTRAEKRRLVEIALEEVQGKMPVFAGTWATTTKEVVETARDAKSLGAHGIFVVPPGLGAELGTSWDADAHPEAWLDQIQAQVRAVDLPIIPHPTGGSHAPFLPGIPLQATLRICREVPNVVGWKMTYNYDGARLIAKGLRSLDRHVAILAAHASRFQEYRANTDMMDGTLTGCWMYALGPMLDHLEAWDNGDVALATKIWLGGLRELHEYVDDRSRHHLRYKIGLWLRGLIPNPYMRAPMPLPEQVEIETMYRLMKAAGIDVIDVKSMKLAHVA